MKRRRVYLISAYYEYRVHRGIARYAHEAGWILQAQKSMNEPIPDRWLGDGLITFHGNRSDILGLVERSRLPTVDLGRPHRGKPFPCVRSDNVAIGRMAAEHFLSLGHRRLIYVKETNNDVDEDRLQGFRHAIGAAARELEVLDFGEIYTGARQSIAFEQRVADCLCRIRPPFALMGRNDALSIRLLQICEDLGLEVPDQVAVLGVDNDELVCGLARVPLSSVDADQDAIGYAAAQILDRMMAGEQVSNDPILIAPSHVAERESTGMLAVDRPEVATALRFIRENYAQPILVEDVARTCSISRRRLGDLFMGQVGRSIHAEILRLRIAHAKDMLANTGEKIGTVAKESGLGTTVRLCKVLRRYLGMSPREYRLQHRDGS